MDKTTASKKRNHHDKQAALIIPIAIEILANNPPTAILLLSNSKWALGIRCVTTQKTNNWIIAAPMPQMIKFGIVSACEILEANVKQNPINAPPKDKAVAAEPSRMSLNSFTGVMCI